MRSSEDYLRDGPPHSECWGCISFSSDYRRLADTCPFRHSCPHWKKVAQAMETRQGEDENLTSGESLTARSHSDAPISDN